MGFRTFRTYLNKMHSYYKEKYAYYKGKCSYYKESVLTIRKSVLTIRKSVLTIWKSVLGGPRPESVLLYYKEKCSYYKEKCSCYKEKCSCYKEKCSCYKQEHFRPPPPDIPTQATFVTVHIHLSIYVFIYASLALYRYHARPIRPPTTYSFNILFTLLTHRCLPYSPGNHSRIYLFMFLIPSSALFEWPPPLLIFILPFIYSFSHSFTACSSLQSKESGFAPNEVDTVADGIDRN